MKNLCLFLALMAVSCGVGYPHEELRVAEPRTYDMVAELILRDTKFGYGIPPNIPLPLIYLERARDARPGPVNGPDGKPQYHCLQERDDLCAQGLFTDNDDPAKRTLLLLVTDKDDMSYEGMTVCASALWHEARHEYNATSNIEDNNHAGAYWKGVNDFQSDYHYYKWCAENVYGKSLPSSKLREMVDSFARVQEAVNLHNLFKGYGDQPD